MSTLLTVLIVIASIILVLVVLIQKSKGGGLSSGFSSSNAIMGVRKTTDFIEKATWYLAGFVIVASIACVMIQPKHRSAIPQSEVSAPVNNQSENAIPDFSTNAPVATPAPNQQTPSGNTEPVPAN